MEAEAHTASQEVVFTPGRVYLHHTRRKQLMRFICIDEVRDQLIFKLVEAKWNKVERLAVEFRRDNALKLGRCGKLVEEKDYIRPPYLSLSDEELKQNSGKDLEAATAWLKARDDAHQLIQDLVGADDCPLHERTALLVAAYSPATATGVVNAHAKKLGVKPLVLKRLLHKYAWFGFDKNALLNLDPFKGRTGPFVKKYQLKPGPNNAAVELYGERYRGRARTRKDITIFELALETFYVGRHMTLTETYEAMLDHYYYQANQTGFFPIRRGKVPTFSQFSRSARILIGRLGLEAKRAGHKDGKEKVARRGHDTSIGREVGDVFDLDGTPFNKELVSTYKVDGKAFNIGKATAIVVFDRGSKKAVGWHVYVGSESWKEGYRLALFCALTSKTERLKWLQIDAPNAWLDNENIVPGFAYVDGGPGASKKGQAALARLVIDFFRAPPDTPYWKPTVEGGQRIAQDGQAHDGGAYKRTNDAVDKDAKRKATLYAKDTVWTLERKLVLGLIKYNRKQRNNARLTLEMRKAGVRPSPEAMFSWGVAEMGGVQKRHLREADVYEALIDHDKAEVTINGISKFSGRYQSDRLLAYRTFVGKNVNVDIMYHPLRPSEMYWRTPDGAIDRLVRDEDDDRDLGQASVHDITEYNKRMLALGIVERHNSRPGNMLTRRQRDLVASTAGVKPKQQRKSATNNVGVARGLEAGHHQGTRPYDRPENHALHLAAGGPPSCAGPASTQQAPDSVPAAPPAPSEQELPAPGAAPTFSQSRFPSGVQPPGRVRTADLFALSRKKQGI